MESMQGREYRRRIYYYDTDAGGVVYHGDYFHFCEEARTDIFRRITRMGIREFSEKHGINFVISRSHSEYKRPVPYDSELVIRTYLEEITGVRFKYRHEMFVDGVLCVVMKIEAVSINPTFKPVKTMPWLLDAYRKAFGL
ncbi:MAG: acyl-CoA thioesterase [Rickettsiales bacterium]|jgi:acyl-CoA thioester hydrolase|nr:acyl-CoA thioesterase [Rickettsiales bacterium]